jgi:hypothetical protein
MPKELKKEFAVVVGSGPFPFDMLRYDACFPGDESNSRELGHGHYNHNRVVVVAKYTQQPGNWTPDRWKSFGWTLIVPSRRGFQSIEDARQIADITLAECKKA